MTKYKTYHAKYHPDDPQRKLCRRCGKYKDRDEEFTYGKALCNECRREVNKELYKNNQKIRDYYKGRSKEQYQKKKETVGKA